MAKRAVREYWSTHPLGSYESPHAVGTPPFFMDLDSIRSDSSRFAMGLYDFEAQRNRRVLDVGCGPGWLVCNYARWGAKAAGSDLTRAAARAARANLAWRKLDGCISLGDAERLPYPNNTFDFVVCEGVLHHTPDPDRGVREIHRVLRPDGNALIAVYFKNLFLRRPLFWLTKLLLIALRVRMHGHPRISLRTRRDDFVRWYDGVDNPIGTFYSRTEAARMLQAPGFEVIRAEVHYFPLRFLPGARFAPRWLHRLLDRWCGTLTYFRLCKRA